MPIRIELNADNEKKLSNLADALRMKTSVTQVTNDFLDSFSEVEILNVIFKRVEKKMDERKALAAEEKAKKSRTG